MDADPGGLPDTGIKKTIQYAFDHVCLNLGFL